MREIDHARYDGVGARDQRPPVQEGQLCVPSFSLHSVFSTHLRNQYIRQSLAFHDQLLHEDRYTRRFGDISR